VPLHTHARTHARAHARAHTRTHARTHAPLRPLEGVLRRMDCARRGSAVGATAGAHLKSRFVCRCSCRSLHQWLCVIYLTFLYGYLYFARLSLLGVALPVTLTCILLADWKHAQFAACGRPVHTDGACACGRSMRPVHADGACRRSMPAVDTELCMRPVHADGACRRSMPTEQVYLPVAACRRSLRGRRKTTTRTR
jgi:hypothetical protein